MKIAAAFVALSMALPGLAWAQAVPPAPGANAPVQANPFTPADIDPALPFGAIDVIPAGNTAETVMAWAAQLTEEQKVELTSRCLIIGAGDNYQPPAKDFCTTWTQAMTADPAANPPGLGGVNPAGVPAGENPAGAPAAPR